MLDNIVLNEIAAQAHATPAQQRRDLDASTNVELSSSQIETLDALDEHIVCA